MHACKRTSTLVHTCVYLGVAFEDVLVHAPLAVLGVAGLVDEHPLGPHDDLLLLLPLASLDRDGHQAPRRLPRRLDARHPHLPVGLPRLVRRRRLPRREEVPLVLPVPPVRLYMQYVSTVSEINKTINAMLLIRNIRLIININTTSSFNLI